MVPTNGAAPAASPLCWRIDVACCFAPLLSVAFRDFAGRLALPFSVAESLRAASRRSSLSPSRTLPAALRCPSRSQSRCVLLRAAPLCRLPGLCWLPCAAFFRAQRRRVLLRAASLCRLPGPCWLPCAALLGRRDSRPSCTLSTHPERADLSCLAHHLGASRKLSTCCVSRLVHRLDASPHAHGALAHAPIAFDPTRGCIAIGTGAQSCRGSGASRRLLIATHPHIPTVAGQALPPPFTDTTHNSPYAPFSHPPSYARASLHRCAGMRGVTEGCPH